MKKGWVKTTLGKAFATATGNTPPKNNADFYGQFMPLVKPPELCDATLDSAEDGLSESGAKVARTLPTNSILVSCIGNLGKVGLNAVPVAFNQQINAILPDEKKALPEFMFYQVLSCSFKDQLEALASGTTVPIVNKSKFNSVAIVLPPLPDQQRIVTILDEAFDGIATAKANAEKNLKNARALFESHLQAVFSQRGDGWVVTTLESCCAKILAGGDVPKGRVSQERTPQYSVPIYSNGAKNEGLYGFTDVASVMKPSVTISARGTIGFSAIRTEPFLPVVRLIVLVPDEATIDTSFLHYAVMGMDFENTGTSIPQLTVPNLRERQIYIPPLAQQRVFVANLDAIREETQHLESIYQQKLAALDALKKTLLDQAFTGRL